MPFKSHDRTYDLVLFGATGFTGTYAAEYITKSLPTDLKWALAGRSHDKLAKLAADIKQLNPDRLQPVIEISNVDDAATLAALAKKTYVLISTVGPYGAYGEPAFKACAENGTHYVDVTGEVPFVASMVAKYENAAKASGALLFPQSGIESAPADLAAWEVARINREELHAKTANVTAAIRLKAKPSGGTLLTVLTILDNFTLAQVRSSMAPYALSPVARPSGTRGSAPWLSYITGGRYVRNLGQLTTSMSGTINDAQVERTWGLRESLKGHDAYGPNFSFHEYSSVRNWFQGLQIHFSLAIAALLFVALPPFRALAKHFAGAVSGTGPDREESKKDYVEYRAVGVPDIEGEAAPKKQAFTRATFYGGMYDLTGILAAEAAYTILQDDLKLDGGIYTPSFLGPNFITRLGNAGFKYESKLIDA